MAMTSVMASQTLPVGFRASLLLPPANKKRVRITMSTSAIAMKRKDRESNIPFTIPSRLGNFKHLSRFSISSSHYAGEEGDEQTSKEDSCLKTTSSNCAGEKVEEQTSKEDSCLKTRQNYEVFLSFRGKDTRHGFTDHLYRRLADKGIEVFRDREGLFKGENIDKLLEAIRASEICVPIISPRYGRSKWCLMELVEMLECNKLVLPIFYKVQPSDVRVPDEKFGKEFKRFAAKYAASNRELVDKSMKAFETVVSLNGWESDKFADRHEGELVEAVVNRIFDKLRKAVLDIPDFLVGVEDHVEEIKKTIDAKQSNDAKVIIIHGMGGIGKTTLAKSLYNKLSSCFESCSFVPNIREVSSGLKGMEALQKQMISDILVDKSRREISHVDEGITIIEKSFKGKSVLLLLDDVENNDQLNKLVGKSNWFGSKSRIIITTRNKDVNVASAVNLSYQLPVLSIDQSYKLFCKYALGENASCPCHLETIAKGIISTTGGLPLALKIFGSYLRGESDIRIWKETLERLSKKPDAMVGKNLKISYDALEDEQKKVFLDVACLPFGFDLEAASYMWSSCGFYPRYGIKRLISLSLVELIKFAGEPCLVMHDQLRDLGREIVREQADYSSGLYSRLWLYEEAMEVLLGKQGTRNVQGLILESPHLHGDAIHCTSQQFEGMMNLRFLHMSDILLHGDFEKLFQNLRWLQWKTSKEYINIMGINFDFKKLVVLDLINCDITEYWKGWRQMKYLKVLKLQVCKKLTTTPDFSLLEELEVLVLRGCLRLTKIHPTIGRLSNTLTTLDVSCNILEKLPVEVGKMEELRKLDISQTEIREIPISEGYMKKLETLEAWNCEKLVCLPDSVGSLVKLQHLILCRCFSLTRIPVSIGKLRHLIELDLRSTGVTQLPDSIGDLYNLEQLLMRNTPIKYLPTSIGMLSKLQLLDLIGCKELESLSILPASLTDLRFNGDSMETLPDISRLTNLNHLRYRDLFERRNRALNLGHLNQLKTLRICHSKIGVWEWWGYLNSKEEIKTPDPTEEIDSGLAEEINLAPENFSLLLGLPLSLVDLEVYACQTLHTLPNLSNLKDLSKFYLSHCSELMEINGLEGVKSLTDLKIISCRELSSLGDLSHLKMMKALGLRACEKLSDVQGIEKLTSLTELSISGCHPEIKFPDLSMLKNLECLRIKDEGLVEISGLQELKYLKYLCISGCKSLQFLPDLSQLTNLEHLDAHGCENLIEIRGLEKMTSLKKLDTRGCTKLRKLPHLPNVDNEFGPLGDKKDDLLEEQGGGYFPALC